VAWEINSCIQSQEQVDLPLALELGLDGGGSDLAPLDLLLGVDLFHLDKNK
jgi:hypothetical protein